MNLLMVALRLLFRRIYLFLYIGKLHFFRSLFASLGLLITLFIVVLILGLMRPVSEAIVAKAEGALPGALIKLTKETGKQTFTLPLFSKYPDQPIGFTRSEIAQMRQWKGVNSVHATQLFQQPAMATVDHALLANFNWYFDILMQGVSPELVRPYLRCNRDFKPQRITGPDGKSAIMIPIVVPEMFAELARTYAVINGMPGIDLKALTGVQLRIFLGQSITEKGWKVRETVYGKVCGFVPDGIISSIGVPLSWVESQHKLQNQTKAMSHYDQAFLNIPDARNITPVLERAQKRGYKSPEKKARFEKLHEILNRVQYVFWGFAAVLLLLSVVAFINSFSLLALEKKYEFGLYLVFGASPVFLWALMFLEGAFWGLVHAAIAIQGAEAVVPAIWEQLREIPMASGFLPPQIPEKLALKGMEKIWIILGAVLIAGFSSLLPTILLLSRGTLSLVKKD